MCGIAGVMSRDSRPLDEKWLKDMAAAMAHRGPDDEGIELYKTVGFSHRRLSIIDLAGGHQPIRGSRGEELIINGEIYNYKALRSAYKDYPFKTKSDAEVALPLYQNLGLQGLDGLRGMYGLALYDPRDESLILARDPFGIKQLYYAETEQGLFFASEIKALLATGLIDRTLSEETRAELLQLRYTAGSQTIFEKVKRLLPGERLQIKEGRIVNRRFQKALPEGSFQEGREEELLRSFERIFSESVRLHLESDVPYGLFLSGGLDSALVLAMMARHAKGRIKTYTIGFSSSDVHDERSQAGYLAQLFKTKHTSLEFSEKDFWSYLPKAAEAMDDPIFDHAMLPTLKLAETAAQDVKVVLSGEGGDELLAGYRRFQKASLPWWLGGRLAREKGTFDKANLRSPALAGWRGLLADLEQEQKTMSRSRLQIAQALDVATWLPNNLLIKLDRCLMHASVEGRTPFLDPEVSDFCFALPDAYKIKRGQGKWILRRWLEINLPEARPFSKKKGFRVPVEGWMFEKGARLAPLLARQRGVAELLPAEVVQALFTHPSEKTSYAAWMILFYGLWHQHHVCGIDSVPDTLSFLSQR